MPTEYNSIIEVVRQWFNGADFNKYDTYLSIEFLWINRAGSLLQFLAGLSIIIEIIGKARIASFQQKIEASIKLNSSFKDLRDRLKLFKSDNIVLELYNLFPVRGGKRITKYLRYFRLTLYKALKTSKILYRVYKFLFIILLAYSLLRTIINLFYLAMVEIFILKPVVFFLWATQKDRGVKAFSFFLLLLGFLISFLFSY